MTFPKNVDRRSKRTQQLILQAALSLIAERGWDKTTVQEITQRADLGRSTFCSHYETKEDLILSGLAGMIELLEKGGRPHSHAWMNHLEDNSIAIRNALRADGRFAVLEQIRKALTKRFIEQLSKETDRSNSVRSRSKQGF